MTPTLAQRHLTHPGSGGPGAADAPVRARDWAEIQERMLVPLYEAVYERLDVRAGTRLLGIGCGSGLALLMAAARGAAVTGVEQLRPERLRLARERLLPPEGMGGDANDGASQAGPAGARLIDGGPAAAQDVARPPYNLITAFQPVGCTAGDAEGLAPVLAQAAPLAERGSPVVLAGWGPPERCATSSVLRVATRLTDPLRSTGSLRPARRDCLEDVARRAGLEPDGSGRVACPFGYADLDSAIRGLLSTGLFDAAVEATDLRQVRKELREALHPHLRRDGTVWMANVFRYLVARVA